MSELQNRFYACKKEGIILVLQALDAAGKDSLIRHAVSGMNPQGVRVTCFKRPSEEELSHDYLWRVNKALPARGEIAVFNRSYYEDVITAKVLHLKDTYQMSERILSQSEEDFIDRRIRQACMSRKTSKESVSSSASTEKTRTGSLSPATSTPVRSLMNI